MLAEAAWHGLNVLDVSQAMHISNSPECYREVGIPTAQLFGDSPSKQEFIISGLLYSVGYHVVSDWLEDREYAQTTPEDKGQWRFRRTMWHTFGLLFKAFAVTKNHTQGIRPFGDGC